MKRKSQREWVIEQLDRFGEVTRNQCLGSRITRLSAIMLTLKNEGYQFTTKSRGGDYVYVLGSKPKEPEKVIRGYVEIDGERIAV